MIYPDRNRIADLNALADHILRGLYTWTMPADFGVDYCAFVGDESRKKERCYLSSSEIIGGVLRIPWPEEVGDYPEELHTYARKLFQDVGAVLRARGGPAPQPPVERPRWADMKSNDGLIAWTVPQDLIPFAGIAEIASLAGMLGNYNSARRSYSSGFLDIQWSRTLEIWKLRKQVHDLTGGRGVS